VVWFAEGYIFSRMLAFSLAQTVLLAVVYIALAAAAVYSLARPSGEANASMAGLSRWRTLSAAPMVVAIVGSFVSLPLLLLIAVVGKLL
jgi:hypothetical protein